MIVSIDIKYTSQLLELHQSHPLSESLSNTPFTWMIGNHDKTTSTASDSNNWKVRMNAIRKEDKPLIILFYLGALSK